MTSWDLGVGSGLILGGWFADSAGGLSLAFLVGGLYLCFLRVFHQKCEPHFQRNNSDRLVCESLYADDVGMNKIVSFSDVSPSLNEVTQRMNSVIFFGLSLKILPTTTKSAPALKAASIAVVEHMPPPTMSGVDVIDLT